MNQNPAKEAAILSGDFHEYEMEHSRVDWDIIRSCTREEKQSLLPFVRKLRFCEQHLFLSFSGLSAWSNLLALFQDPFEQSVIMCLLNSGSVEWLYNALSASALPRETYLEYALFLRFCFPEEPYESLDSILTSYLGVEFVKKQGRLSALEE